MAALLYAVDRLSIQDMDDFGGGGGADSGQILHDLDAMPYQMLAWSDSGSHEQGRALDCTTRHHD